MSFRLPAFLLAAMGLLAGCVSTPADENAGAPVDTASTGSLLLPVTEVVEGDILLSAAAPMRTLNYGGTFSTTFELTQNVTGVVVEVEWAPATPASEKLAVWVRAAGMGAIDPTDPTGLLAAAEPLARASGAGPLRLAVPADMFPEPGEYDIIVRAAGEPVGVAANQPFTIHLTTFAGIPFDDAFSALGAPAEA